MPPTIHLKSDARLDACTIQSSPETVKELRLLLGENRYRFENCLFHADDEITVSPDLYEAFDLFLTNLSGTHNAV